VILVVFFFLPSARGGRKKKIVGKVQEANKKEDFKVRKGKVYYA